MNATVNESETATFRCSVENSSFVVLWYVNGSSAAYTRYRERGVRIVVENEGNTRSRLEVEGRAVNNNTLVHCIALLISPPLSFESNTAWLVVRGGSFIKTLYLLCHDCFMCR